MKTLEKLFCDNKLTIIITHDHLQNVMTEHIEIDSYFIKEKLNSGFVITPNISYEFSDETIQLTPSFEWLISIYEFEGECFNIKL